MATIEVKKLALIQFLLGLDDEKLLDKIERFLFQQEGWTPTPEELQGIKEAMAQVENGKYISLSEAKERHKKWLK